MPPVPSEIGYLGVEILNGTRRWAAARNQVRRLIDSKSATQDDVKKATAAYNKTSDELEVIVRRLERLLLMTGQTVPMGRLKKKQSDFPWMKVFSVFMAEGAKALEHAVNNKVPPQIVEAEVIDVESET